MNGLENILYFKFKLNQKAYLGSISRIRSDPLKPFHTRLFFRRSNKKIRRDPCHSGCFKKFVNGSRHIIMNENHHVKTNSNYRIV